MEHQFANEKKRSRQTAMIQGWGLGASFFWSGMLRQSKCDEDYP